MRHNGNLLSPAVVIAAIPALIIAGWVMNIAKIVRTINAADKQDIPVSVLIRLAGVVLPPLGAIMGWF